MPKVSLGPWTPDFGPLGNTGVVEAKNVLPHIQGYKPLRNPLGIKLPGSLSGMKITGAVWVDGIIQPSFFVSTAPNASNTLAKIFWSNETTAWTDKTQVTASISTTHFYQFTRFGNLVIAGGGIGMRTAQKITLSFNGVGANFENLGGTPGACRYVTTIRDFVVLSEQSSSSDHNMIKWSALGNAEDWTVSATTQSDEQTIQSETEITALVGGEYGLIFSAYAIYRMNYIGPPAIFQFDKISDVGAYPGAVTKLNDNVYFIGPQGFGVVRGGYEALILSSDSIDQYLRDEMPSKVAGATAGSPILASDPRDRVVAISYLDRATLEGAENQRTRIIFYDESLDRFSRASLTHQWIFSAYIRRWNTTASRGFSVSYEHMIALIDESRNLAVFEGENRHALIETGEGQMNESGRTFVNQVIPYVNGTHAPMVRVGVRERQHQTVSFGATVTANVTNGVAPVRAAGRFHRLRIYMSASASWSLMTGFEIQGKPDGVR